MGSDNHCNLLFITKDMKILPKIAPCARIESSCGFVEQQYGGMMKQALSQFQPPLHSSRKRLSFFAGALRQSHTRQHLRTARFPRDAAQPVSKTLMQQVFRRSQFQVETLRLD